MFFGIDSEFNFHIIYRLTSLNHQNIENIKHFICWHITNTNNVVYWSTSTDQTKVGRNGKNTDKRIARVMYTGKWTFDVWICATRNQSEFVFLPRYRIRYNFQRLGSIENRSKTWSQWESNGLVLLMLWPFLKVILISNLSHCSVSFDYSSVGKNGSI